MMGNSNIQLHKRKRKKQRHEFETYTYKHIQVIVSKSQEKGDKQEKGWKKNLTHMLLKLIVQDATSKMHSEKDKEIGIAIYYSS